MWTYLKDLWYNPESFSNLVRALMFAAGELPQVVDFGSSGSNLYWVGKALQVAALAVRSGSGASAPVSPSSKDIAASYK